MKQDGVPRRLILASPIEPSGASWLVNCFLELGIRVDHTPGVRNLWRSPEDRAVDGQRMWRREGTEWTLHPRAEVLGKWLPILMRQDHFQFRDDISVTYVQEFPGKELGDAMPLFFLRDPRDAIYSHYRRRQSPMAFADYIRLPNPVSLMPMAEHWLLYAQCWQSNVAGRLYRFEDYKRDALALLSRILSDVGLTFSTADIAHAVENSSSEAAREAEARYKARHPEDTEVANRAGKVGDWQERSGLASSIAAIGQRCGAMLSDLGYDVAGAHDDPAPCGVAQLQTLDLFGDVALPPAAEALRHASPEIAEASRAELLSFAETVTEGQLTSAGYTPADSQRLLASLQAFLVASGMEVSDHIARLHTAFGSGSSHHMAALRDLMRRNRAARRSS